MYISHRSGRRYNRLIRLHLQSDFFVLPIKKNKAEKISFHIDDKEDVPEGTNQHCNKHHERRNVNTS